MNCKQKLRNAAKKINYCAAKYTNHILAPIYILGGLYLIIHYCLEVDNLIYQLEYNYSDQAYNRFLVSCIKPIIGAAYVRRGLDRYDDIPAKKPKKVKVTAPSPTISVRTLDDKVIPIN